MTRPMAIRNRISRDLADPLFRNAYALLVNAVGTSALGFVYWVLAARLYSATFVGASSALIAALLLAATAAQLNLGGALARFLPRSGAKAKRWVLYTYLVSGALAVVLGFAVAPWLLDMVGDLGIDGLAGVVWIIFAVSVWCVFALQDHILTGLRQAGWVPIENAVFGVLKIVLLVALAGSLPATGIIISWTVPMALMLLPVNALIFRRLLPRHVRGETHPESVTVRHVGRFVAWDYLGALFNLASTQLLPVLVAARIGAEANGYFYVAWVIMLVVDTALVGVTSSLTVEGSRDQEGLPGLVRRLIPRLFAGLAVLSVLTLTTAPYILNIFGPQYSENATFLLRLLALGLVPRGLVILWMAIARVRSHVSQLVVTQGAVAVIVLGLSAYLMSDFGITGVGIAYLAGQGIVAVALLPRLRMLLADLAGPTDVGVVKPDGSSPLNDLSVVIPVRNAANLLDECLRSVVRAQPAEIIVVDGESADETLDIARRYPVKIISDGGAGLPAARTLGARAARTRYVALIDADVVLNDGDLQMLLDEFIAGSYLGLHGRVHSVADSDYWSKALANHDRWGFSKHWFGLALTIFERDKLLEVGFDHSFGSGEDIDLRLRLSDMQAHTAVCSSINALHRYQDGFAFAKNQWMADGSGLARVMRKRGIRSYWLVGLPVVAAGWGAVNCLVRLRLRWLPYYVCYMIGNYVAMAKELKNPTNLDSEAKLLEETAEV